MSAVIPSAGPYGQICGMPMIPDHTTPLREQRMEFLWRSALLLGAVGTIALLAWMGM